MSNPIYEVLFRGEPNGQIVGAHVVYFDGAGIPVLPIPITPENLPECAAAFNVQALADKQAAIVARDTALEEKAAVSALLAEHQAIADAAFQRALAFRGKVPEELVEEFDAILSDASAGPLARIQAAAQAKLEAALAEARAAGLQV